MATTIATFRNRLRRHITGAPNFVIDDAVVDAIIEFAKKTEIFRISVDHPEYANGVNEFQNDEVEFVLPLKDKRPLKMVSLGVGSEQYSIQDGSLVFMRTSGDINGRDDLWDSDKKYYNFPSSSRVAIFPIDTSELATDPTYINFDLVAVPEADITEIDDEIYDNHREAIECGAMARCFAQAGIAPWADGQKAAYYKQRFETEIGHVTGNLFNAGVLPLMKRTSYI